MGFQKEAVEKLEQTIRGHQKEMTEIKKQLKEWTRHASSRDAYYCWAHQQANPNLTEIPIHQIPDLIQANAEKGRHIFQDPPLKLHHPNLLMNQWLTLEIRYQVI
ncbi:hypothetical protein PIB30_078762 [Stylosanthes scabra]|uniref:Uncharacterized protein n=1 Tax=Stylosanthes scabra TaxID=79078 RepID=A0ABU6UPW1_9FABA|nr:hypothetical protein [Stylosanthes scabra]